jgi:uncharacterized tellurite resistance protein B-like protein
MGFGKILGMAALGIGAVAAAPFTGGGSLVGAATLAGSLAGAGAVAAGAGAVGAAAGAVMSSNENDEKEAKEREIANLNLKANKAEKIVKDHQEHTNIILALSAMGCAMANADGEISPEEIVELNEFTGGLASQGYPEHIVKQIESMIDTPPTFNEAMKHLEKVEIKEYSAIRDLLVIVMESDDVIHKKEKAFLSAFDIKTKQLSA